MDDPVFCPTCATALAPEVLWQGEQSRCPSCDAEIEVPEVLAAIVGDDGAQLEAFPTHAPEPDSWEPDDDGDLELALGQALTALEQSAREATEDLARMAEPGELLTDDLRRILAELNIPEPRPDASVDEVEHTLAEARRALGRLDDRMRAARADDLLATVEDLDPEALLDEELTDPSLFFD